MPGRRFKIRTADGIEVEAEEVAVVSASEPANTYQLDDGSKLTLRTVCLQVARVIGKHDGEGNPLYTMKSQNIMTVLAPDNLRQGGRE